MTRSISFLSDFEEINEGYVAFGGNSKGGKIYGKGKIKTGKLDFHDVYFVKELKFNIFSVSQMCDKKNNVLFTDTECVVLSYDYKLSDENHVLLRVPRETNMQNVDLKNVVPSGGLNCLFSKATLNESNLWYRRLGHINFKTMNKLANGNLVRGLPLNIFENNHTCVACKKGKQHKASCIKENLDAGKIRKETISAQQYVLLPLWSTSSQDPQNTDDDVVDAAFDVKENENDVHVSTNGSDKTDNKKHDEKAKRDDKGKIPVDSLIGARDLRAEFEEFYFNSSNRVNAISEPVNVVGPNTTYSTNNFNTASPSVNAVSLNFRIAKKFSFVDPSKYPDDPDMLELEDIVYSDDKEDVGAKADLSNLETNIPVSPIPTTRVHKDYPVNQIIDLPKGKRAIGSKWVFRSKKDERGTVIKNKARLVAQGHTQDEGIDYDEVFAPVKRIEAIRLFLAYASFMGFMVYQMDVKNGFLYRTIKEEVYVCQPLGFEDPDYPDKVYMVVKALYGLHQAPRAWKFGFTDVKSASTHIETEKPLLKDPDGEDADVHIYRSMIGSLMYFTSSRPDIMFAVCACKRFQVTPKVSHLHAVKRIFSDCDGASFDRKSTTGGCQFLGYRLISWQCGNGYNRKGQKSKQNWTKPSTK
nr:putative ribonuclease H-like domain-containing protein [Tanacetum cinerariifolium]